MAHQVVWTKIIVETFIEEAMLTKDEEIVLRTREKDGAEYNNLLN